MSAPDYLRTILHIPRDTPEAKAGRVSDRIARLRRIKRNVQLFPSRSLYALPERAEVMR